MKNKTTFHRVNKTENYTVILNDLIKSLTLSSDEKVILLHLLSLPNDWSLYKGVLKEYYKENIKNGRFNKSWKGLIEKGYLTSTRVKDKNGKFNSWKYEVHEVPISDIPKTEVSGIGVIEKSTHHKQVDKQSTNKLNTNLQSINESNNTSIILGITEKKKKNWTDKEIQLDINSGYFNEVFKDTGIDWEKEIISMTFENFIQKYTALSSKNGDEGKLRFFLNTYYQLTGLNNSQTPRRE